MKCCIICEKVQRIPEYFVHAIGKDIVVCEAHKEANLEEITVAILRMLTTTKGIETWDYLWQGPGQT